MWCSEKGKMTHAHILKKNSSNNNNNITQKKLYVFVVQVDVICECVQENEMRKTHIISNEERKKEHLFTRFASDEFYHPIMFGTQCTTHNSI